MNEITVNLAEKINRAFQESVALAKEVSGQAAVAIEKAVECGRLMLEQKEALLKQKGNRSCGWLDWLDTNCPKISEQTARRYMSLAKLRSHVSATLDCTSLRRAYIGAGILKETKKEKKEPGPETPWVRYTKGLDAFRLWYHNRCEQGPMETWGEDALRLLSKELQWFVNLHAEIQKVRATLSEEG